MVDGHDDQSNPAAAAARRKAPHSDGPLGSSGAAPEDESPEVTSPPASDSATKASKTAATPGDDDHTPRDADPPADKAGQEAKKDSAEARLSAELRPKTPAQSGTEEADDSPWGKTNWLGAAEAAADSAGEASAKPVPEWDPFEAKYASKKRGPRKTIAEKMADARAAREFSAAAAARAATTTAPPTDKAKDQDPKPQSIGTDEATAKPSAGKPGATSPDETVDGKAGQGSDSDKPTEAAGPPGSAENKPSDAKATSESLPADAKPASETPAAEGKAGKPDESAPEKAPTAAAISAASQGRATRVLRKANPAVRAARSAGRRTSAWAKRPTGRLLIPALIAVLLVGGAGTAGAYLVPKALEAAPAPSATPGFGLSADPSSVVLPSAETVPTAVLPSAPAGPIVGATRPAEAFAGWAQQVGTRVGIPVVAVEAYAYAEYVLQKQAPNCHLSWTTIAAIAQVESDHGSANGSVLGADGEVQPPIYGLPLDGKGGRQLIADTDQGTIDKDTTYDRAVGPLQFIPSTWRENAVDADNNGVADPNDIDDAALTAAVYLCKNGRDLSKADSWFDAILSYNALRPYAQKVFDTANLYGQRSRT